jgi:glycopeptide antibiotics resistance protein
VRQGRTAKKGILHADGFILFAAFLLLLAFFATEWKLDFLSPPVGTVQFWRCAILLTVCIIAYLGCVLLKRRSGRNLLPFLFLLFLFLYLYLIVSLTLLDKGLRLDETRLLDKTLSPREYYLKWYVNFRPFESIYTVYIRGLLDGYVSVRYVVLNLLGNLCAFMPLSILLPALIPCMRRWYCFLPTVLLTVVAVEGLQFWLMVGSCDVDDVILNVGGAIILYLLFLIPPIRRFMERFRTGEF